VRVFRLTLSKLCFKFRSVSLCVTNLKYFWRRLLPWVLTEFLSMVSGR
jgi:hypothetical protein